MTRETLAVRKARLKWTSYTGNYGPADARTVAAARELAETRADAAEAEARRLRQLANLMAVSETAAAS